jgi:hypothetical protein
LLNELLRLAQNAAGLVRRFRRLSSSTHSPPVWA